MLEIFIGEFQDCFCGICRRQPTVSIILILKIVYRILCKTEESRPYYTKFQYEKISVSIAFKYIINTGVLKYSGLRHGTSEYYIFLSKIDTLAIAFYWRNDIHNLCHLTVFIPKSVRPRYCSSLVVTLPLFIVFKFLIPYIGSLDKCHTSAFNALICKSHNSRILLANSTDPK